ncbi:Isochorismatase family protein [uncultured archaeon]|nr:Isochorismatase family protein [uncultured archaeon]
MTNALAYCTTRGAGKNPPPQKVAMVIVDMQTDSELRRSFERTGHGRQINEKFGNICRLASAAKESGSMVVLTRRVNKEDAPEIDSNLVAAAGTPVIVEKTGLGAFSGTSLEETLRKNGVGALVIAGFDKYKCVLAIAKEALERGFVVLTSEDTLIGSRFTDQISKKITDGFFMANTLAHENVDALLKYFKKP